MAFSANPAGNLRGKSAFFKDWDMNGEIQSQLGCLLGGRTHQRSHFAARPRQTPAPGSLWLSQVQCFRFSRLSEQIMSLCFACITQCHLVTLKRGLFGGSVALLSQEWVVNCQGAARVPLSLSLFFFLLRRKETQWSDTCCWLVIFCVHKQRQRSSDRGLGWRFFLFRGNSEGSKKNVCDFFFLLKTRRKKEMTCAAEFVCAALVSSDGDW